MSLYLGNTEFTPFQTTNTTTITETIKYSIKNKLLAFNDDETGLTCKLDNYAINVVSADSNVYPISVFFPEKEDGKSRDFMLRFECTDSTQIPTVSFVGQDGESIDFESEQDDWSELEAGANLFNFTETKQ